jgi:hypothetical protein
MIAYWSDQIWFRVVLKLLFYFSCKAIDDEVKIFGIGGKSFLLFKEIIGSKGLFR